MEIRPAGYLSQHLEEPQGESQEILANDFINKPIFEGLSIDYTNQKELRYEKGDAAFKLALTSLSGDEAATMIQRLNRSKLGAAEAERGLLDALINFYSSPTYNVDKFYLQKGGNVLDLEELQGKIPNIKIIINPKKQIGLFKSNESGQILVSGDITKIDTILVILHEIGHRANPNGESLEARSRFEKGEHVTEPEAELILENERKAWAFALQRIKPFLNKESRDEVIRFIHADSLQSYSDGIRAQIAPRWKLFIPHIIEYLLDVL